MKYCVLSQDLFIHLFIHFPHEILHGEVSLISTFQIICEYFAVVFQKFLYMHILGKSFSKFGMLQK